VSYSGNRHLALNNMYLERALEIYFNNDQQFKRHKIFSQSSALLFDIFTV